MAVKKKSPWAVFVAIFLAIIVGSYVGTDKGLFGITFFSIFEVIGKLFINALTLVVVPLVSSSVITGVARIGNDSAFGRLGFKIFSFYIITSFLAIVIGLFMVNLLNPGQAYTGHETHMVEQISEMQKDINLAQGHSILDLIYSIVPPNIVDVFHGKMLALIFFSILFGYAMSKIDPQYSGTLMSFWQGVFHTMLQVTHIIMRLLPLGVFCLVAQAFATTGLETLRSLAWFVITVLGGLGIFALIGLPLLLRFVGQVDPWLHFRAMAPALITAFSTSSSSATLPITIDCVEKRAGVSNRICSLVIPLGTSVNMSGSALYECIAALFIAQIYGMELTLTVQFLVVSLALITSMGIAGIPSGSIVAIIVILNTLGLPVEAIGILFAVDRVLDMFRTTVNVFSDSCCAVLVARSEGEKGILTQKHAIFET